MSNGQSFGVAREPGERPLRNAMHEHRSDDTARGHVTNQWPRWSVPHVHDAHERATSHFLERPFHVHARRDTAHMPKTNRGRPRTSRGRHRHERRPEGRPAQNAEWPVRRHLYGSTAVASPIEKPDKAVMR